MMSNFAFLIFISSFLVTYGSQNCDKSDFTFQYTECDRDGNRWRVAIPKTIECANYSLTLPVRGKKCNFTCESGHYLDIEDQECKKCPSGTFSLGGGVRYDDWPVLPNHFSVRMEKYSPLYLLSAYAENEKDLNCTGGWVASGKYMIANITGCPISLTYEAEFVRKGHMTFTYENNDDDSWFGFQLENERCERIRSSGVQSRSLKRTEEGKFVSRSVDVTPGLNRFIWTVIPIPSEGIDRERVKLKKFIKIKFVEIQGIAFTSECTPCRAGTFSSEGQSKCESCQRNTYSLRGADRCVPCMDHQYSEPESDKCLERPRCTDADYYQSYSPCDAKGKTSVFHKWNDNKICDPANPESVRLPGENYLEDCSPCNPGTQLVNGSCSFCPKNFFSTGKKKEETCQECPSSTSPQVGMYINSWRNVVFKDWNITTQCIPANALDSDCVQKDGWILERDHLKTTNGNSPTSFLLLNINIPGFRSTNRRSPSSSSSSSSSSFYSFGQNTNTNNNNNNNNNKNNNNYYDNEDEGGNDDGDDDGDDGDDNGDDGDDSSKNGGGRTKRKSPNNIGGGNGGNGGDDNDKPVAHLSFVFEMNCAENCTLFLLQKIGKESFKVVETWYGTTERQKYTLPIFTTKNIMFTWTFQQVSPSTINPKSSSSSSSSQLSSLIDKLLTSFDKRKTNEAKLYSLNITNTLMGGASGCEVCPQGVNLDGCIPCSVGHYIDPPTRLCKPCTGNTILRGMDVWGAESCVECGEGLVQHEHDVCVTDCTFKSSSGSNDSYDFTSLSGPRLLQGPHLFTTSGYKYFHMFNVSLCSDHRKQASHPLAYCASNFTVKDDDEDMMDSAPYGRYVSICRTTALPSDKGMVTLTNPLSFGDRLTMITDNPNANITKLVRDAKLFEDGSSNVYFIYKADQWTRACRSGRTTVIVLRCNPDPTGGKEELVLPPNCPDGTCDGCNFVFLWKTKMACPVCAEDDYVEFSGDCVRGEQQVVKKTKRNCSVPSSMQMSRVEKCNPLWLFKSNSPLWMKVLVILVPIFLIIGLLSMIILIYCWNKNRKLQYKYMKLVESSAHARDGMELPGVDSCGIDEGEEEEQFDAIEFKSTASRKKNSFFGKIIGGGGRGGSGGSGGGSGIGGSLSGGGNRKNPSYYEKGDRDERMTLT